MQCKYCGETVRQDAQFCPNCGGSLAQQPQNQQPYQQPPQQPYQQQPYGQYQQPPPPYQQYQPYPGGGYQQQNAQDQPSGAIKLGGLLCGFFMPIVALIVYFVLHNDRPNSASAFGKFALIGFGLTFVVGFAIAILAVIFSVSAYDSMSPYGEFYYDMALNAARAFLHG